MKCNKLSKGIIQTMTLICMDIIEDKSKNSMKESIELLKAQMKMLEEMELISA